MEVMVPSFVDTLKSQALVLNQNNYESAPYHRNQTHHAALQTLILHR